MKLCTLFAALAATLCAQAPAPPALPQVPPDTVVATVDDGCVGVVVGETGTERGVGVLVGDFGVVGRGMPVGPTTLGGANSPEGSSGVGSKETHPDDAPR